MHRAACGRASGLRGRASGLRGRAEVLGKGVRKCSGRAKAFSGEWVVRSAGVHRTACGRASALRGERKCSGRACIAQPAGVRRHCVGVRRGCVGGGSARRGRVAVWGRAEAFGGEWVVRSAGLTHIRRSSSRTRVLLYIRPPCLRREIAAMGLKDAPCTHPSPAKPSAPAPSAFALPRPRSHFPRPHSHFPRIAFRGPRGAIGIPQQQLSTMGYPRKSYPHRCSPPCAKRSRPRACARVYIISRSPVGCSRGVSALLPKRVRAVVAPCPAPPCAGWGRAKAKADAPSRSAEPCRLCVESLCAKAECTRQTPPLPVRSPRGSLSTAAPLPAYGRTAVCKGGSAPGQPRPCPCTLPAATCLRPCPCPLMGEAPCVGWGRAKVKADAPSRSAEPCRLCAESLCAKAEVHKVNPAPARALSPRQLVYRRAPAR